MWKNMLYYYYWISVIFTLKKGKAWNYMKTNLIKVHNQQEKGKYSEQNVFI